jgi:hypothetical protein
MLEVCHTSAGFPPNLDADLLIDTLLLLLDLLLELLDRCTIRRGTVRLENLNIPGAGVSGLITLSFPEGHSHSSVRGVIFFSSISSSAKFFWYFSQLEPVAEGCCWLSVWDRTQLSLYACNETDHDEDRSSPIV